MQAKPFQELYKQGVSVWLDSLSREMLRSGSLKKRIEEEGLRGQTSNPTIFQGALSKGDAYDPAIKAAAVRGDDVEALCWALMVEDVRGACDLFAELYRASDKTDGFVSLELDPTKAHDTQASMSQARDLWPRVDRPNLMLKVPGTSEGLPVVEQLLYEGMNVNVTLLFSVKRYGQVIDAFMKGLERRVAEGLPVDSQASVASFFVSRVESEADKRLDAVSGHEELVASLRGKVAVANARAAYELFEERFSSERWKALEAKGARLQRPLWASTSTKNPAYSATLYVDDLVGPHCVNTMPEKTMAALTGRSSFPRSLTPETLADARQQLDKLARAGVDLDDITLNTLVVEGVKKFADSYRELLDAVAHSMEDLKKKVVH